MKKTIILGLLIILLSSFVSADLDTGVVHYYTFDGDADDSLGTANGTVNGATQTPSGIIGTAYYFDGVNDYIDSNFLPSDFASQNGDWSVSFWINSNESSPGGNDMVYGAYTAAASDYVQANWQSAGTMRNAIGHDATVNGVITTTALNTGSWYHVVYTYDGSNYNHSVYVNGVYEASTVTDPGAYSASIDLFFGARNSDGSPGIYFNGILDEMAFWQNNTLQQSDVTELYNSGAGKQYPFSVANSITATAVDVDPEIEDSTTTLNLTITSTGYNITASDYGAVVYNGTTYTATKILEEYGLGANVTYTVNVSTPLTELNNSALSYQWFYNLTFNASTEYQYNESSTQNLLWKYPRINITRVYNAFTGQNLTNFTGDVTSGSYNYTFNTTSGSQLIPLTEGNVTYTAFVNAPGYAIHPTHNFQNVTISNSSQITTSELQFGLYSSNSVYVYVYKEEDGSLITQNVTLTVSSNTTEETYTVTGGSQLITNLTDNSYLFELSSSGYTDRSYTVTVADNSHQTLNAYLSNATDTVTFTFVDSESTGTTLEGVDISMSRYVNGTYQVVESRLSDITGRVQFTYSTGENYRFTASRSDYQSKTFTLNPILFSTYTVKLDKNVVAEDTSDYSTVSINFDPTTYYNNLVNNFTITFNSPTGTFTSYSVNITYPGGNAGSSGTNAYGESFTLPLNITGASKYDVVNITYSYDTTYTDEKTFNYKYEVITNTGIFGTALDNQNNTYGMSLMDRILVVVLTVLVMAGLVFYFAGFVPSAMVGMLVMGYFTKIGMMPLWAGIISEVILFVLIAWGSSR